MRCKLFLNLIICSMYAFFVNIAERLEIITRNESMIFYITCVVLMILSFVAFVLDSKEK